MYCTACGNSLTEGDRFCSQCGKASAPGPGGQAGGGGSWRPRRFVRSMKDKKIAGVCSGIAHYLDSDLTLIRVIFLALIPLKGVSLIAYAILWAAMPRDDQQRYQTATS
jgi:phage shock protein C